MKNFTPRLTRLSASLLLLALAAVSLLPVARADAASVQRREHLTEQEVEMVRNTQELDRRVALFVKIAERRVAAVVAGGAVAPSAKDVEKWGELPKGTRAQLFNDLARILDEAINNIDDVGARSPNSSTIPKAVRHLSEAAARFLPQLTALRAGAEAEGEREALEQTIDSLEQVLDAAKQLPAETTEKKGDKKDEKKKP
ncbi:MAG: hypothetical protein QOD32_489 [Pyrinomonadaceae bacterium]|jgi:hypothetical protein|nr:hypothetical protein [Pyrinomonadaceae bacterium]